jgi:hypothetical protein
MSKTKFQCRVRCNLWQNDLNGGGSTYFTNRFFLSTNYSSGFQWYLCLVNEYDPEPNEFVGTVVDLVIYIISPACKCVNQIRNCMGFATDKSQ